MVTRKTEENDTNPYRHRIKLENEQGLTGKWQSEHALGTYRLIDWTMMQAHGLRNKLKDLGEEGSQLTKTKKKLISDNWIINYTKLTKFSVTEQHRLRKY